MSITPVDRPRCICRLLPKTVLPSPFSGRVGVHNFPFEACSDFTRVTAHRFARPPEVAFVAGLRSSRLPDQTACQLPGQPTVTGMRLSLTSQPRRWGAPEGTERAMRSARGLARRRRSVPQEQRQVCIGEHVSCYAAKQSLAPLAVGKCPHDQQVGAGLMGGGEDALAGRGVSVAYSI